MEAFGMAIVVLFILALLVKPVAWALGAIYGLFTN